MNKKNEDNKLLREKDRPRAPKARKKSKKHPKKESPTSLFLLSLLFCGSPLIFLSPSIISAPHFSNFAEFVRSKPAKYFPIFFYWLHLRSFFAFAFLSLSFYFPAIFVSINFPSTGPLSLLKDTQQG